MGRGSNRGHLGTDLSDGASCLKDRRRGVCEVLGCSQLVSRAGAAHQSRWPEGQQPGSCRTGVGSCFPMDSSQPQPRMQQWGSSHASLGTGVRPPELGHRPRRRHDRARSAVRRIRRCSSCVWLGPPTFEYELDTWRHSPLPAQSGGGGLCRGSLDDERGVDRTSTGRWHQCNVGRGNVARFFGHLGRWRHDHTGSWNRRPTDPARPPWPAGLGDTVTEGIVSAVGRTQSEGNGVILNGLI